MISMFIIRIHYDRNSIHQIETEEQFHLNVLLKNDEKDRNVFHNYHWYISLTAFMLAVTMETLT